MFRYAVVNLRKNLDGTMIESGLELADRIEAAWDINRVPGSRFQDAGPTRFGSGSTPTFSTLPNGKANQVDWGPEQDGPKTASINLRKSLMASMPIGSESSTC